ncbi:MAG: HPF/RaiA family ribosome-associated protein [Candidatus Gracilibacteria bacterium]
MAQTKKAKTSVKKEPVKSLPTNITAKNLTNWEKKQFVDYLIKKEGRISKLTKHFSEDSVLLTASVEKFEKHTAFKVLLKLTIPSDMIIAEESAHAMTKGLDDATDRLITQLKKHIDKVKNKGII